MVMNSTRAKSLGLVIAGCLSLATLSGQAFAGVITAAFTNASPVAAGCGTPDAFGRCTNSLSHSSFLSNPGVQEINFQTPNLVTINNNNAIAVPGSLTGSLGGVATITTGAGGASIEPGQLHTQTVSIAAAPWNNYTQFLSIPSSLQGSSSGSATFNFGADLSYLGFNWGSVDTYNSLSFYSHGNLLQTFTGSDVVGFANANGGQMSDASNGFVDFFLTGWTFDAVTFNSSNRAFEIDNLAYGNIASVPAPFSLSLLALGVAGLGVMRRRKTA